jgi:pSer/pThr/pTyr-binding forkhead associated (FHA) protein
MAKLVVLSEGMTGQSYELKVDKTTVGRVDDNAFQIPQSSVSSHHCEIFLKGNDVVVKDLNSTNGTFINNQQVTGEAVLKAGQILRLGQVEIRLEPAAGAGTGAPAAPPQGKRPVDSTMAVTRGVSLEQLEQGPQGFDTTKGVFTKKTNKTNKWFIIGGVVLLVIIVGAILAALSQLSGHGSGH